MCFHPVIKVRAVLRAVFHEKEYVIALFSSRYKGPGSPTKEEIAEIKAAQQFSSRYKSPGSPTGFEVYGVDTLLCFHPVIKVRAVLPMATIYECARYTWFSSRYKSPGSPTFIQVG